VKTACASLFLATAVSASVILFLGHSIVVLARPVGREVFIPLVLLGIVAALGAVVLGAVALSQMQADDPRRGARQIAVEGIAAGAVMLFYQLTLLGHLSP
jgi:hypothetical protein